MTKEDYGFRRIVVGCDGEAAGQDALALAEALGRPARADLLAVGVYPDPLLPFPIVLTRHAGQHEACEHRLRADRDAIAPDARILAVPSPSPAMALRHAVEHHHADLLVLGSDRGTPPGEVRPGRHARQILHDVGCAVAIAPAGFATHPAPPRRVVVGFDDSPEAADALAVGQRVAAAAGGELQILTVITPMPVAAMGGFEAMAYLPEDWDTVAETRRRQARELLDETISPSASVQTDVVEGDPGVVLSDAGRSADLLVVGSRRWGPLARLVFGSTSEYVVRHSHCAVLVVPRRAAEAPEPGTAKAAAATA